MLEHDTPPEDDGQNLELAAALVRQMPRNLPKERRQHLIRNQKELKEFLLGLDGQQAHLNMLRVKSAHESTLSQKRALEIMGKNGHGLADVENCFGVEFSQEQKAKLAEVYFSEKVLEGCASTHILFPGFPLNLLEIRSRAPREPQPDYQTFEDYEDPWYNNQAFAKEEKVAVRWHLVRRDAVPDSIAKTHDEQTKLIAKNERIPTACELAYGLVLHFLATEERLMRETYALTASVDSDGGEVGVGSFRQQGLRIGHGWDNRHRYQIGVVPARNLDRNQEE